MQAIFNVFKRKPKPVTIYTSDLKIAKRLARKNFIYLKNKVQLKKRWQNVLKNCKKDIKDEVKFKNDKEENKDGWRTYLLARSYRLIGSAEYLVNNDIKKFRKNLSLSCQTMAENFLRLDNNDIETTYWVDFKKIIFLLDGLASGDMEASLYFSKLLGGRDEFEQSCLKHQPQGWEFLAYSMKFILEGCHVKPHPKSGIPLMIFDGKCERKLREWPWVDMLKDSCYEENKYFKNFRGIPDILDGILDNNLELIDKGFQQLIKDHRKECIGEYKEFDCKVDQDLYIWAIGLTNLCRHKGLDVQIDHPLVPAELLIPVNDAKWREETITKNNI
jgi:hypothetical protein